MRLAPHRRLRIALAALAFLTAGALAAPPAKLPADDPAPPEKSLPAVTGGTWSHAYAAFNSTPKYPRGFKAFDWVNPDAPKGGTIYLANPDRRTSFDKFNPFTLKGNEPTGVRFLMFEGLTSKSGDEPGTVYGLLAEEIMVAPDKSSISFRMNPKARFSNGDPVQPADVKHSFDMLTSKGAAPYIRQSLEAVKSATVVDERTVRFDLADHTEDAILSVSLMPVFSRKWGSGKPLDEIVTEYPITSGPYTIASVDSGRGIEFKRNPDYWGRDLSVRRGLFNFDRVVYRLYRDRAVAQEAFKAGEFDLVQEFSASQYVRNHQGAKWQDGRIVKKVFEHEMGQGLQSYVLNLRRPIFQDRRVREALDYTYDFEKINLYNMRIRAYSVFSNSDFAAKGLPNPGELKLLEPFRKDLPPEVFGMPYKPPRTDTSPNALRENLRKARALFEEAGWKIDEEGVMRNAKGEPFEFEYIEVPSGSQFRNVIWQRNLAKLGIKLRIRTVDYALFHKRLEAFDFDATTIRIPDFSLPSGADYVDLLHSKGADVPGSNNLRGVKDPAVDAITKAMADAKTYDELRDAARALDRVVMHQHYQVPQLYSGGYLMSYWNKFGIPATPKFYLTDESQIWLDSPTWCVIAWWIKEPSTRAPQPSS